MAEVSALFFDIGGVILTNGWDRHQRRSAVAGFGLDWEEFQDRHDMVADSFETGSLDLDGYLDRTVFYRERDFSRDEFVEAMWSRSAALPGMIDVLEDLTARGRYFMATLNNESAALNRYRIEEFGLRNYFDAFFSSSSLGVKKPDKAIYDMALSISMRAPSESVFIDDRELNLACASLEGMQTVHHRDAGTLRSQLAGLGIDV